MAKAKGKKKTEVLDYGAQVRSLREQGAGAAVPALGPGGLSA